MKDLQTIPRARLEIKRSIAPSSLWHWAVIYAGGHIYDVSKESYPTAELCMGNAAIDGLKALLDAEGVGHVNQ